MTDYDPPIQVNKATVHGIDTVTHTIVVLFYVDFEVSQDIITKKLNTVLNYLAKENFIPDKDKIRHWKSIVGVIVGNPPPIK